ncbi:pseudouridine-5'-phosphate glycosidase [uncultured Ilyobacter sp.]|uniref:pseudouridine-5'-phosphate glycosidase n=1 Tax=uncultured Ilyobacter sp. TaxID=544433 RepID=UPI0029F55815|nr:pseudouridine-5'-phosphate glycosidase [uncultured Ilyobacter sp.]
MQFYEKYLDISPEIEEALEKGLPVVALESTIISHGMPYPKNVETALEVEKIIRDNGAIPATIAILKGRLKVGLSKDEIDLLGKTGLDVIKTSRRDLPFIISKKLTGATTVASTMIIASFAGIRVFATGGIGGVHRGAETTFDISADLQELAHTNVAVICAGAKSILDIGLTLEYLETNGVPVVGYQTDELPAFYTRKSGFKVDYKVDNPKEIALALKAKWELGLKGGMVIANPIPEEYSMDHKLITEIIKNALIEAEKKNIKGKESTPFLLAKVKELTEGKSLESNIQLIYNNAKLAAEISKELASLNHVKY